MPLVESTFRVPFPLSSPHFQTIWPALRRRVAPLAYQRERLELPDGDFLDLDWVRNGASRLAIVTHGLEGASTRRYVRGMGHALGSAGWDVLAWNLRGCGGAPNRLLPAYHSGKSEDLRVVVQHAARSYTEVVLVGFSVGGNITLKFLGEEGSAASPLITAAFCLSVPVDLASSAAALARPCCRLYSEWLLRPLRRKLAHKASLFADCPSTVGLHEVRTFADFDQRYTAPLNGFSSAVHYWQMASSLPYLSSITVPTLLINAKDDPFLGASCFPFETAKQSKNLFLVAPKHGGHVGFMTPYTPHWYWAEERAIEWFSSRS